MKGSLLQNWTAMAGLMWMTMGCVHHLATLPPSETLKEPVVFGHIHIWQAEPSGRIFLPELATFEFVRQESGERYRVDIGAVASTFIFSLEPGRYQLTRLILREGEFRAGADVPLIFEVPPQGLTYLGKWSLQVEPPNFRRDLVVRVEMEVVEALVNLKLRYPILDLKGVVTRLAEPTIVRARLYEMTPYPRFRWFNRHNPT